MYFIFYKPTYSPEAAESHIHKDNKKVPITCRIAFLQLFFFVLHYHSLTFHFVVSFFEKGGYLNFGKMFSTNWWKKEPENEGDTMSSEEDFDLQNAEGQQPFPTQQEQVFIFSFAITKKKNVNVVKRKIL